MTPVSRNDDTIFAVINLLLPYLVDNRIASAPVWYSDENIGAKVMQTTNAITISET